MRSPRYVLAAAAVTLALAPLAGRAAVVGVTHATVKVRPGDPPPGEKSARLQAARNEFEAFQVAIRGPARNVRATATPLTGPSTIPAPRLYRAELIHLVHQSDPDSRTGPWPDALVPAVDDSDELSRNAFTGFHVRAGETRVVWAEVFVPPGTPAGVYMGAVSVAFDGGSVEVPVSLEVWPFTIPSTATLKSATSISYPDLVRQHGVAGASRDHSALLEKYVRLALDHRLTIAHVDDGSGTPQRFEEYFGPLMRGAGRTRLAGARLTSHRFLGRGQGAWSAFYAASGYDTAFQYTCDEPPNAACGTDGWNRIDDLAREARAANPRFRSLVTTSVREADARGLSGDIDILVPVVNWMHDKPGTPYAGDQRAAYDRFLERSPRKELWLYQSCMSHGCGGASRYGTGWPSYMIDASAIRNRAMEWISFLYRATGELYYAATLAYGRGDPWTSQWAFTGNGDGTLFYPGTPARIGGSTHVPIASIRLKMIREGMEDYEYLALLEKLGDRGFAESAGRALFPNPYTTERDPLALYDARAALARRIVAITGGEGDAGAPPYDRAPPAYEHSAPLAGRGAAVDGSAREYGDPPIRLSCDYAGCDGTAEVRVAWDRDHLYAHFEVDDPSIAVNDSGTDGENWNGDGVEILVDAAYDRTAELDDDDFHILVSTTGAITDERGAAGEWDRGWTSGATAVVVKRDGGYAIELRIPWSRMGMSPCGGEVIGLDVAVNDLDVAGARRHPYDWARLTRFAQPARWGRLTLSGGECR